MNRLTQLLTSLAFSLLLAIGLSSAASAANGADFQPGRIMDDPVFYNKDSMSVGDIQNFLADILDGTANNGANVTCDTQGNNYYIGTYGGVTYDVPGKGKPVVQRKGLDPNYPPPYTCLKDYYENTTTHENNLTKADLQAAPIPAGGISAAQIIYNAAQAYGISPKVLIVMIQKESLGPLLTDDWPWYPQYKTVMGYGCPDTAGCDANYFGFYNQVWNAARQFRIYANNPNSYNYAIGLNNIKLNPNAACGTQPVNIVNQATASLYIYTPYVPNTAALNNLYGLGDSCSSYGNRNFWRMYTDWFGSTLSPNYYAGYFWNSETLDGTSAAVSQTIAATGQTPVSINYGSTLQLFYYESTGGNLRRAYSDTNGWHFETLDGAGGAGGRIDANVGSQPAVVVYQNTLHVFYYDTTNGNLRHGWSDATGANWQFETLDGAGAPATYNADVGVNPSATVFGTGIQLFYYDRTNGNLRHAWIANPTDTWKFENLDGDPGAIGRYNVNLGADSTTAVFNGTILQIFYYDQTNGNLRHAWNDPIRGWLFENLDGDPGAIGHLNSDVGRYPALMPYNGGLQLFYYDAGNGNLRHAWITASSGWLFENLDGDPGSVGRANSNLGLMPSVASDSNNRIYVSYYDQQYGNLRMASTTDTGWKFANVEGDPRSLSGRDSNDGLDSTVTVYNGTVQVFHFDATNQDLIHAWGGQ